ncbi:MAG: efflux RND transporter periplasmic adaptor subunit [Cyanobacteria bacterium P01_A01_bin.114]
MVFRVEGGSKPLSQRWVLGILIVLGVAGGVALVRLRSQLSPPPPDVERVAPKPKTVTALGRLEPAGDVIQLSPSTSNDGGNRVAQLLVAEGETVEAGQVIAILDSRDRIQADLAEAQERVKIAQVQLEQTLAGAKQGEIAAQQAEIARLEAQREGDILAEQATLARQAAEVANAEDEYTRYQRLYEAGAISASERDSKRLVLQTAQRSLQEAQAVLTRSQTTRSPELDAARANLEQIQEIRPVDVRAAEAEVARTQAAVTQIQRKLDQAYVKAPQAGTILKIYARPGEVVAEAGIVEMGQISQMVAIAEIYDSDVRKVNVGQSVTLTSGSLPDETLRGTVEYVGLQIEQQSVVNEDPTANIDAKVVEVNIKLDEDSSARVRGLTNLQVIATIEI